MSAKEAARGDTGAYNCVARNTYGSAERTIRLVVEEVPDSPTELRVTDIASKSCSVKWSPPFSGNLPLNKYLIQWKIDKGNVNGHIDGKFIKFLSDPWTSAFSTEISGNSAQLFITDLKPLTNYDIRIVGSNSHGDSEPSKSVSFVTEEEAPSSSPLAVRVEPLSSSSVKIKWKVSNPVLVRVFLNTMWLHHFPYCTIATKAY